MTLLAIADGGFANYGVISYPSGTFANGVITQISPLADIYADLINPDPDSGLQNWWSIAWQAYLQYEDNLENTARYISALPKYQSGTANITYNGVQTYETFLNYQSLIFPVCLCFSFDGSGEYPSPFIPESPMGNAAVYGLGSNSVGLSVLGTDLYINPSGFDASTATMQINYGADFNEDYGSIYFTNL
jgi:hypothetical protein